MNLTTNHNQDPSDYHTVIDFEVYNLTANGSVDVDAEDTLIINVDAFDLDNVDLSLEAPPIPLPENVINALLKEMVNATVPYLNDWLEAHPFNVPDDIADFLPNPQLSIVHQDIEGDNRSQHGYAQLLVECTRCCFALPCSHCQICSLCVFFNIFKDPCILYHGLACNIMSPQHRVCARAERTTSSVNAPIYSATYRPSPRRPRGHPPLRPHRRPLSLPLYHPPSPRH